MFAREKWGVISRYSTVLKTSGGGKKDQEEEKTGPNRRRGLGKKLSGIILRGLDEKPLLFLGPFQ